MTVFALAALQALAQDPEIESSTRLPTRFVGDDVVVVDQPTQDLFAIGRTVEVRAPVGDNVFVLAQTADIDAPVNGDVLATGQTVRIDAPVSGDVYAFGEHVEVLGAVAGNVYVGAAQLRVSGPIGGELHVGAGEVWLDGPIDGDVFLEVGELTFGSSARIGGDLAYESPNAAAGAEDAVEGAVRFTAVDLDAEEPEPEPGWAASALAWTGWTVWRYLALLTVGLVVLAIGGSAAARIGRMVLVQPGRSLGLGFVGLILVPVGALLAMALVIPLPLGVLALMAFVGALYGAQLFTAQALGDRILQRFRPGAIGSPAVSMAVGLAPIVLLASLPWVGTLVWLVATCFGIGALWLAVRGTATV